LLTALEESVLATGKIEDRQNEISKFLDKDAVDRKRVAETKKEISEMKEALDMSVKAFQDQEKNVDHSQMEQELTTLRERKEELEAVIRSFEEIRTLEKSTLNCIEQIESCESEIEVTKIAEKVVKALRADITNKLTKPIEEIANELLGQVREGLGMKFKIEDGHFTTECVNLQGQIVSFSTLSGGERLIYSFAQLCALVRTEDPPLKIIQGELGELSGDLVPSLAAAVNKISGQDIQVMLSSCHTDYESPKGWDIVVKR